MMMEIREYLDSQGRSAYARWFNRLDAQAAAKVVTALVRMEQATSPTLRTWAPVSWNIG